MRERIPGQLIHLFKTRSSSVYLLLMVLIVSLSLLLMNYFTIKILSGVRAYINGESYYSKGQKDASRSLMLYLETEEETYWQYFVKDIQINLGDKLAREMMLSGNIERAKEGLLIGNNHPEDVDVMIWLFQTFKNFSFMQKPILYWTSGDLVVMELQELGFQIRAQMTEGQLNGENKRELNQQINELSTRLTGFERKFSGSLGETARNIRRLLWIANVIFIIVIMSGASIFLIRIFSKLLHSESRLLKINKNLKSTNSELDRFVYSASHDLRAPITSLKGLINIAQHEKDSEQLQRYFDMMKLSLEKQDRFIKKIISFSKNKRAQMIVEKVDLEVLVEGILNQHKFMHNFADIEVMKDIKVGFVWTDSVRLEIILSNLISNAIKYADKNKKEQFINIEAYVNKGQLNMVVSDNGIGIGDADIKQVFQMFYMTKNNNDGSGVGLYIVKETIDKLNGLITVESEKGKGSKFKSVIPVKNDVSTY